jgi:hypothetical protein
MKRDRHATTKQGYNPSATHRTPDRNGSLLVTLMIAAVLPAAILALINPTAVVNVAVDTVVGLVAGGR